MPRTAKISAARLLLRKTAAGASALRRAWPAWCDREAARVVFSPSSLSAVSPRVQAELFLRSVPRSHVKRLRASSDVRGGR